jgi:hypothetical protein
MKHGRVDANQKEIVRALRAVGATVQSLADVGRGCPDLLVGFRATNYLLEVKDGSKPPSARTLTTDEDKWFVKWYGTARVVYSVRDALLAIGIRSQ